MNRLVVAAGALVIAGTSLAACSSGSSSSTATTAAVPVTKAGHIDCAKFKAAADAASALESSSAASATTPAQELKLIRKLDAISTEAISLVEPIAPQLVATWKTQTAAQLSTLEASVKSGASISQFTAAMQKANTTSYQNTSKQIGSIVRAQCPQLYTTTTTGAAATNTTGG